jgi:hypothetical protein
MFLRYLSKKLSKSSATLKKSLVGRIFLLTKRLVPENMGTPWFLGKENL